MANIVSATIRLLQSTSPQDITLRDIARESGHGHRLIVEWFGGKGGLFAAVFTEIFRSLRESGELFYANVPTRTEVRVAFQVFNYMHMHHREFVENVRDTFVLQALQERLVEGPGLAEDRARLTANRLSVLTIGLALFRDFFSLSEEDAVRMMQDEFETMTGLELPASPPAT